MQTEFEQVKAGIRRLKEERNEQIRELLMQHLLYDLGQIQEVVNRLPFFWSIQ